MKRTAATWGGAATRYTFARDTVRVIRQLEAREDRTSFFSSFFCLSRPFFSSLCLTARVRSLGFPSCLYRPGLENRDCGGEADR